jgi:hypothetical protein
MISASKVKHRQLLAELAAGNAADKVVAFSDEEED